jgi:catalase
VNSHNSAACDEQSHRQSEFAKRRLSGLLLLQEYRLIEQLTHQNRECIPAGPVHVQPFSGTLFIFIGRQRDRITLLGRDQNPRGAARY